MGNTRKEKTISTIKMITSSLRREEEEEEEEEANLEAESQQTIDFIEKNFFKICLLYRDISFNKRDLMIFRMIIFKRDKFKRMILSFIGEHQQLNYGIKF